MVCLVVLFPIPLLRGKNHPSILPYFNRAFSSHGQIPHTKNLSHHFDIQCVMGSFNTIASYPAGRDWEREWAYVSMCDCFTMFYCADFELLHVDEFVDELLHSDRVCDIILPRLQVVGKASFVPSFFLIEEATGPGTRLRKGSRKQC